MDREVIDIYLDDIIPNRFQPREVFSEDSLRELASSIKEHGIIHPILVRKIGDKYEIIAGERRYKASTLAGLTKIPAIVRNMDDKEASKIALLENLQRKDLTAIEEARTYQKIIELDDMTQEKLGLSMGKSQATIANKMRLLSLPDEVQEALLQNKISERHARSLLNLNTPEEQVLMLEKILNNRMTVRELDNEIKALKNNNSSLKEESKTEVVQSLRPRSIFPAPLIPKEDTPEQLEILEQLELEETKELENNTKLKQPETDFQKIDKLLQSNNLYTVKGAVDDIKGVISKLQNKGFEINLEEMDFENTYQVVVKIEKD